jgi:hypothetical protein
MQEVLVNQKILSFSQKVKSLFLKVRFRKKVFIAGEVKILGKFPIFKFLNRQRFWIEGSY